MAHELTEDQKRACDSEGSNIIVSAGAGSGKTAVLTARIERKLVSKIKANQLLVLTFTKLAAASMKQKIAKAMMGNKDLVNRLDELDSSYITTFDSYALSIVKKYHYILNVPKNVKMIDSAILNVFKTETMAKIFEKYYLIDNKHFNKLLTDFALKNDNTIRKELIEVASGIDSLVNRDEFIENIPNKINEGQFEEYFKTYSSYFLDYLPMLKDELSKILPNVPKDKVDGFKVYDFIFNASNYDELYSIIFNPDIKYPKNSFNDESLKASFGAFKELYSSILDKDKFMFKSKAQAKDYYLKAKDYAIIIRDIFKEYFSIIDAYKKENEAYEFNDIAKMAISIVKDHPDIASELKNSYKEILIDEYQDTNDIQETFISYIANNNVYMVGDMKQSIYRFRNANPKLFKEKYFNYGNDNGGKRIDLINNFRSNDAVVDLVNTIFLRIMDEKIGDAPYSNQVMHRRNDIYDGESKSGKIIYYEYPCEHEGVNSIEIEMFTIMKDIQDKISKKVLVYDDDLKITRECTYKDFAIILPDSKNFDEYQDLLNYNNIPSVVYKNEDIKSSDLIPALMNFINLIVKDYNHQYDGDFYRFLLGISRSFIFNIDDETLFDVVSKKDYQNFSVYKLAHQFALMINNESISTIIDKIIDRLDIINKLPLIGNVKGNITRLEYFTSFVSNMENNKQSIFDMVDSFNEIIEKDNKLEMESMEANGNNVTIMTIHKSKGLEYPICYFAQLDKKFNDSETKGNFFYNPTYGLILPYYDKGYGKNVDYYLMKHDLKVENISEKIRLLYVALTRARQYAIIVNVAPKEDLDNNIGLVPTPIREKYNKLSTIFHTIRNSLDVTSVDIKELEINDNYKKGMQARRANTGNGKEIKVVTNKINYCLISSSHASKITYTILDEKTKKLMEYGTYIHELFEKTDLLNPDMSTLSAEEKTFINNFIHQPLLHDIDAAKIHKEYEFIDKNDNDEVRGIIDLMLEYQDHIVIIDYKLKGIEDENYIKQLKTYQTYIYKKTAKPVSLYLYSIIDNKIKEIGD